MIGEQTAPDGDPRQGTITVEQPVARSHAIPPSAPPPPDHPAWETGLLVPPSEPTGDLLVARDLDAALRDR